MTSTVKTNDLSQILAPISLEFKDLDQVIRDRLASKVALIDQISTYIIQAGGKRVRPALLMLIAKALANGKPTPHTLEMAAVVEFIHTATLLHDDVVDESTLRRGRETANAAFGNAASVLVGDFLYSRAFQMMVGPNDLRVMQILSDATNTIAEGEVLQLLNLNDPLVNEDRYNKVILYKTAKYSIEAPLRIGAAFAGADPGQLGQFTQFGIPLGMAFQLRDDILGVFGDPSITGKPAGDDLREGKRTVLVALTKESLAEKSPSMITTFEELLTSRELDAEQIAFLQKLISDSGALQKTERMILELGDRALENLDAMEVQPEAKATLKALALKVINRDA